MSNDSDQNQRYRALRLALGVVSSLTGPTRRLLGQAAENACQEPSEWCMERVEPILENEPLIAPDGGVGPVYVRRTLVGFALEETHRCN